MVVLLWGGRDCLSAIPGGVNYKISVFGPKAKMPVLRFAEMLVLSVVEMKPARPIPSVVEVYPYDLPPLDLFYK